MMGQRAEQIFHGQPAAGTMAEGPLHVLPGTRQETAAPAAGEDLASALERARSELSRLIGNEKGAAGDILEFQLALLDDEDFLAPVIKRMAAGEPWRKAWREMLEEEIATYSDSGDEYLAARANDLRDLQMRVLGTDQDMSGIGRGAIVVAADLTPSRFLQISRLGVSGIALSGGSATGHVAILARERGINMIVGLKTAVETLPDGEQALIDAKNGLLIVSPSARTLAQSAERMAHEEKERKAAQAMAKKPAMTADGEPVRVLLNAANPDDLEEISPEICDGIGLTRTEFLFSDGLLPDEETQTRVYERILAWARGKPVTIRTLDAGGDKPIAGVTADGERNPFLGLRGLRLSLRKRALFRRQLRALLRAAIHGELKIMVPMVSVPEEMVQARAQLEKARQELEQRNVPYGDVSFGMMVEVPAAALMAECFDADFYSIGSNDLIQYTLAAERGNPEVSWLADGCNGAVMELIARTVRAGRRLGREVSVCGALASEPAHAACLLDAGVRVFSVAPAMAGPVKLAISRHAMAKGSKNK